MGGYSLATTTLLIALHGLCRAEFHARLRALLRDRTHTILDLSCHCQKRLLDIGRVLGGRLQERNAQLIGVVLRRGFLNALPFYALYLSCLRLHGSLLRQIALVAHK